MKDQIKLEEIRVFVGTGLEHEHEGCIFFLNNLHVWDSGNWETKLSTDDVVTAENIVPYVRPMTDATNDIICGLTENINDEYLELVQQTLGIDIQQDTDQCLTGFLIMSELAKEHYDIFNWIGRKLARPLKD